MIARRFGLNVPPRIVSARAFSFSRSGVVRKPEHASRCGRAWLEKSSYTTTFVIGSNEPHYAAVEFIATTDTTFLPKIASDRESEREGEGIKHKLSPKFSFELGFALFQWSFLFKYNSWCFYKYARASTSITTFRIFRAREKRSLMSYLITFRGVVIFSSEYVYAIWINFA